MLPTDDTPFHELSTTLTSLSQLSRLAFDIGDDLTSQMEELKLRVEQLVPKVDRLNHMSNTLPRNWQLRSQRGLQQRSQPPPYEHHRHHNVERLQLNQTTRPMTVLTKYDKCDAPLSPLEFDDLPSMSSSYTTAMDRPVDATTQTSTSNVAQLGVVREEEEELSTLDEPMYTSIKIRREPYYSTVKTKRAREFDLRRASYCGKSSTIEPHFSKRLSIAPALAEVGHAVDYRPRLTDVNALSMQQRRSTTKPAIQRSHSAVGVLADNLIALEVSTTSEIVRGVGKENQTPNTLHRFLRGSKRWSQKIRKSMVMLPKANHNPVQSADEFGFTRPMPTARPHHRSTLPVRAPSQLSTTSRHYHAGYVIEPPSPVRQRAQRSTAMQRTSLSPIMMPRRQPATMTVSTLAPLASSGSSLSPSPTLTPRGVSTPKPTESLYSCDDDGYYTSMHRDSALICSPSALAELCKLRTEEEQALDVWLMARFRTEQNEKRLTVQQQSHGNEHAHQVLF